MPDIVKELEKELKENKERESRRCGSPPLKPTNSLKISKVRLMWLANNYSNPFLKIDVSSGNT